MRGPEGVVIEPGRGPRGASGVGEHEDGGGEAEAEGREPEQQGEGVDAPEPLDGDGGMEVLVAVVLLVVGERRSAGQRRKPRLALAAAIPELARGRHRLCVGGGDGGRLMRGREVASWGARAAGEERERMADSVVGITVSPL